jgi:enoyl-CoA hydratase
MGLANRVVPHGESLSAAQKLARELVEFPQVCLRGDRLSAYEQFDLAFDAAMANEHTHGQEALDAETTSGAKRFAGGEGRHGSFGKS